ncbi:MAG: multiprotein bridging factor aMBF1 [Methanomassiliicoccales archaeon]|nr:multiprotein bridging factor aMBF1 [Methanomassiliicoccales archaeon]
MICEMCGKEMANLLPVRIEGTVLSVCRDCARFGDGVKAGGKQGTTTSEPSVIQARLDNRERRMKSRDVYETGEESIELAEDFSKRIKEAREKLGWKQEELAAKMNERVSIVHKLESGGMHPDDALIKKVERTLDIKIMEKVMVVKGEKASSGKVLTLEDCIKKKK